MLGKRSLIRLCATAALPITALALAGCGSSGSNASASTPAPPTASNGQAATVGVENTNLGDVLVDAQGRTLYLFQKDTGTTSQCTGSCATFWPPDTVTGAATAGSGADAALLATTMRSDGKTQVTYHGHPVYLYSGDHKAGDTTGQGVNAFGASWFALNSAGDAVTSSSSSGSSGGSGY